MAVGKVDAIQLARERAEAFWGTDLSPTAAHRMATEVGIDRLEIRSMAADAVQIPRPDGGRTVFLRSKQSRLSHRFSLAHEVAHILLEPLTKERVTHRSAFAPDQDPTFMRIEHICDLMAAEILMPEPKFVKAASKMGWALDTAAFLAPRFDVSLEDTVSRLVDLAPEPCAVVAWQPSEPDWLEWKWWQGNSKVKATWLGFRQRATLSQYPSLIQAHESSQPVSGVETIVFIQNQDYTERATFCESSVNGIGPHRLGYTLVFPNRSSAHCRAGRA